MPNIKAAEKWVIQSEKRETRNKSAKNRLKTLYKGAVASRDAGEARRVEGAFDKAAGKGIIHPNKAARKKSRLAQAVARTPATPVKGAKSKSRKSSKSKK